MGINLNPFTWWNGASWGTMLYGLRGMAQVGTDSVGNAYWEGGKDTNGRKRRNTSAWYALSHCRSSSRRSA